MGILVAVVFAFFFADTFVFFTKSALFFVDCIFFLHSVRPIYAVEHNMYMIPF